MLFLVGRVGVPEADDVVERMRRTTGTSPGRTITFEFAAVVVTE
jgi:hypothetical protein